MRFLSGDGRTRRRGEGCGRGSQNRVFRQQRHEVAKPVEDPAVSRLVGDVHNIFGSQQVSTGKARLEEAVLVVNRKIEKLEQNNRLREVDTLVFRFIADRIRKLVDRLAMRWPSDSYFAAEKMVMEELELLREKVDRYPDRTRCKMDNSCLLEQIRSLPIFRDGAGNDVLLAGIVNLLDQNLEVPDGGRSWWSNLSLVRSAKTSCSRISSIAEAVLQGSLFVVIAVTVTMVLARMPQTPQDYFLVPT